MATKEFAQLYDGVGEAFASNTRHRFACCDCGLVHQFVLVPSDDGSEVGMAVRRDVEATQERRQSKPHPFQEAHET